MRFLRYCLGVFIVISAPAASADTFDYYTLAISLTPAYCDQNPKSRNSLQCRDRLPFTVHGLWPENLQGRSPENCAVSRLLLSAAEEKNMRSIMPDAGLRQHEWKKHGVCSGLQPRDYFGVLSREFLQLKWPPILQPVGRDAVLERAVVLREFRRLNPGFPERGVVLRCGGRDRPPLLSEIRVCLSPAGQPMECVANFKPNCPLAVKIRAR